MERTLLGTLFGSLLGIGWLGFVWAPPSPPSGPPGKPDIDWHLLEPVTYENLTIFPVASARGADTSGFLTLDEGLSSGSVVVREQGSETIIRDRGIRPVPVPEYQTGASVNRLVLVNRSKRQLLLDRIVPPDAEPLPLDVFCVEHGRWSAGSVFAAANIMVHPSVREKAAVDQKQEQVWDAVRSGTTAAAPAAAPPPPLSMAEISGAVQRDAPTQAYAKIYDSRTVGLRRGGAGPAYLARASVPGRGAGVPAAAPRARNAGKRAGRLSLARNPRGQARSDRPRSSAAQRNDAAPLEAPPHLMGSTIHWARSAGS